LTAYRSIFLEPDWAHTAYYGWREVGAAPHARMLGKRVGPLTRRLVLAEGVGEEIEPLVGRGSRLLQETIIHDFSGKLSQSDLPPGFKPLPRESWILNSGTYVVDLANSSENLKHHMNSNWKRSLRRALADPPPVTVERHPTDAKLGRFFREVGKMARERALHIAPNTCLRRMFEDDRAILLSCEPEHGSGAYLMIYRAGLHAIWLYSVGTGASPDTQRLLQWRALETLRSMGVRWYDLGGAPADSESGINRFKQGMGGEFVSLGNEWVRSGLAVAAARRAWSSARMLVR
jgi:hypothetical protein